MNFISQLFLPIYDGKNACRLVVDAGNADNETWAQQEGDLSSSCDCKIVKLAQDVEIQALTVFYTAHFDWLITGGLLALPMHDYTMEMEKCGKQYTANKIVSLSV